MKTVSLDMVRKLQEAISYDPASGTFCWRVRPVHHFSDNHRTGPSAAYRVAQAARWNARNAGRPCFKQPNGKGYLIGTAFGQHFQSHRLAWALFYGEWPRGIVDHINRNKCDNRISNLRIATASLNHANTAPKPLCASAFKGVSWHKGNKAWIANIRVGGRRVHLGYFATDLEAAMAYRRAAENVHGDFAFSDDRLNASA